MLRLRHAGLPSTMTTLPPHLDRYVLSRSLEPIDGDPVWRAYDPVLDRPVTLRLLGDQRPERLTGLRRVAGLSHPAVLPVYDLGRTDSGAFVASGYVEGRSAQEWLAEKGRRWREIVELFVTAGRGLAAAHARQLGHGAFTSASVVVDWSGGVWVRGLGDVPGAQPSADLDAFTRALQRALESAVDTPPTFISSALRAALSARTPGSVTLSALLRDLVRDPRLARARRRAAALALGGLTLLAVGVALARRPPPPCQGAAERLVGTWDAPARARVKTAFERSARPEAPYALRYVLTRLDDYARDWVASHVDACEATHVREQQSSAVLDLRMSCLEERRQELAAVAQVFAEADAKVVRKAQNASSVLRPLEACADVAALQAGPLIPTDPATRARLEALSPTLARARALLRAGRFDEAKRTATALQSVARQEGHRTLLADTALLLGILALRARHVATAEQALEEGAFAALALGYDRVVAEASARLVSLEYQDRRRAGQSQWWTTRARAALARAGGDPLVESHLERGIGDLALAEGRHDQALAHFERALALVPADDLATRAVCHDRVGRALRTMGEDARALTHHQRSLEFFERELGPHHPNVAIAVHAVALALRGAGRLREAVAHHERALEIQRRSAGPEHLDVAGMENALAITLASLGDAERADALLRRAVEAYRRRFGDEHLIIANLRTNLAYTLNVMGRPDECARQADLVVAIQQKLVGAEHPDTASAWLLRAECEVKNAPARALPLVERALAVKRHATERSEAAPALAVKGQLLERLQRHAAARTALEEALARWSGPPISTLAWMTALGRVQRAQGDSAQARATLQRAVALAMSMEGQPIERGEAHLALAELLGPGPEAEVQRGLARAAFRAARPVHEAGLRRARSVSDAAPSIRPP